MKLVLPHDLGSLNDWRSGKGAHWRKAYAMGKRVDSIVATQALAQRCEPIRGPYTLTIGFYWPDRRTRDSDNYVKMLKDALVSARLLDDDGPPVLVSETYIPKWDPDRPRIEVVAYPALEPAWPLPAPRSKVKAPYTRRS